MMLLEKNNLMGFRLCNDPAEDNDIAMLLCAKVGVKDDKPYNPPSSAFLTDDYYGL